VEIVRRTLPPPAEEPSTDLAPDGENRGGANDHSDADEHLHAWDDTRRCGCSRVMKTPYPDV
jgi:hypothetical protein